MMNRNRFESVIRALAAFGHRGSATANEAKAAAYLSEQVRELGLSPQLEPFRGIRSLPERCLVHIVVAAAGACLLQFPILSVLIGTFGLLSFWIENTTRGLWLSRLLPRYASANVTATITAPRRKSRIVLVAHYDTQRTGFIWIFYQYFAPLFYFLPTWLKPAMLGLTLLFACQIVVSVLMLFGIDHAVLTAARRGLLVGHFGFLAMVGQWFFSPYVPGAGDNASGVAAALAMTEEWLREPHDDVELQLVLTGCEESGMLGAEAFVMQHRAEILAVPTQFLNMDNLGFGPPRFLGFDCPQCGGPMRYPADLLELAGDAANELGLTNAGPYTMPGPTDGVAFLAQSIPGLTVMSFSELGYMPNYHRPQDTAENLDFDAAWSATELGAVILRRMARKS